MKEEPVGEGSVGEGSVGDGVRVPAPALVADVVALAVAGAGVDGQRRAIVAELERGREVTCEAVVARMLRDVPARLEDGERDQRLHEALARGRLQLLLPGYAGYPARLAQAWPELGAPLWLFRRAGDDADPAWGARPTVAIVGTRRATADGLRTAESLAAAAGRAGAVVVSGLARGIDQASHRGALSVGGRTAAVLGTGVGVDYPRGSSELRGAVARSGGLLTELAPGTPPRPRHFLARNRIIAGLADVTVVVEGRARSGALHTARMAAAQGRDVLAAPGSLNAPGSEAPLALVRDGAQVLTRVEDLLEALGVGLGRSAEAGAGGRDAGASEGSSPNGRLSDEDVAVLDLLGAVAVSVDELVNRTGQPAARVLATLGRLRRLGFADAEPAGVVAREPPPPPGATTA